MELKISDIKIYEKNAKLHDKKQIKKIADSIKRFGFNVPIVIDKNKVLIAGHGRLEASKLLGFNEVKLGCARAKVGEKYIPAIMVEDLTEDEINAYRLADNKLNESPWNLDLAIEELKLLDVGLIDLTGFDKDLIIEPDDKDDEVPEVPEEPKSKLGDLYELGNHRVLCGDSTKVEDVEKLMGGKNGKVLFTSPPYNMNAGMYENYEDNLKKEEYIQFNLDVINTFKNKLRGFLFWNISYNKNSRDDFIEIIYNIIKKTGLKFLELIVWNKKHGMPITSKEILTRQYEDILLVGDDVSIKEDLELFFCGRNDKTAYFNKKTKKGITNYWEIGTNKTQLKNHLDCFPVELPVKALLMMSNEKDIIIDPFLGSGSTLIACEKTNRICYGMELDEKYVDVIIKRYEDYTGNKAIKL